MAPGSVLARLGEVLLVVLAIVLVIVIVIGVVLVIGHRRRV
jgi:hypothetical protein